MTHLLQRQRWPRTLVRVSAVTLLVALSASAPRAGDPGAVRRQEAGHSPTYNNVSRPSEVRELSFSLRGVIDTVKVKVGDEVKAGQEIAVLLSEVQRATVQLAEIAAKDSTQVAQAESTLKFREEEYAEEINANQKAGASSPSSLREAKYRRDSAKIELDAARTKSTSDQVMLSREQARLDEMRLESPIDGTVVAVTKRGGEGVTEGVGVVTIINIDPLWIDVFVPTNAAVRLKVGQGASVAWEDIEGVGEMPGKVLYVSPAADGGARQIQVRVEIPNPDKVPAGLHGQVRFLPAGPGR